MMVGFIPPQSIYFADDDGVAVLANARVHRC